MRMNAIQKSTVLVLVGVLSGCMPSFFAKPTAQPGQAPTVTQQGNLQVINQGDTTTIQRLDTVLRGRLAMDEGERHTAATVAEVVGNATVAIIDTTTNTTIATSVTDGAGNFSIPLPASWNPALGSNYMLEAFKGLGSNAAGRRVIRLRTLIQKLAGSGNFTSLTGTDSINVSPMTTAVYLRSAAGFGAIPLTTAAGGAFWSDSKGTVTLAGALRQVNQFSPGVTDAQLNNLSSMITTNVAGDVDPIDAVNSALAPQVTSFSTYMAAVGSLIAINGSGFSPVPSANTVTFNSGINATVLYASKSQLIVAVPSGATNGNVTVTTATGTSNNTNFTVSPPVGSASGAPTLANVSNAAPSPGLTIQIGGVNFVNGANTVTFSAGAGTVTAAGSFISANQISVVVPASAKSGPITVTNSNGTSNGHWIEVIHASGMLVEDFTGTAKRDGAATNIQWVGGASPVGSGPALLKTAADFDTTTKTNVIVVHDAQDPDYPDSVRLAFTDGAHALASGANMALDNSISNSVGTATYALATNGFQLFRYDNSVLNLFSNGYDGIMFGTRNPTNNVTNTSPIPINANFDLVGFTGMNLYFSVNETDTSFNNLTYQDVTNAAAMVQGTLPLFDQTGASMMTLFKNTGVTYGTKMASDGTYLYILSGIGYVAGVPTYNSAWNMYKFRLDSFTAPTKFMLVQVYPNVSLPSTNYINVQSSTIMADHRAWYLPGWASGGTQGSYTPYSTRNGAQKASHFRLFNGSGYYPIAAYDAVHDVYLAGNTSVATLYRHYIPSRLLESAGNITTTTQTLPAGSAWSQVQVVMDPLEPGASTSVNVDILDAAGNPIAGYQNLVPGASIRNLATTNIKVRVDLNGSGATSSGISTTPVVRGVFLYTIPDTPVARSTSYTIPGADANDRIIIDSVQITHSPNSGSLTYQYADSADNVAFSAFQDSFTSVRNRHLKWQVIPAVGTSTNSVMVPPVTRRIQINYHY